MKNFCVELKSLRPCAEWTYANVFYEDTPKGAFIYVIYDEFGNEWSLDDLASFDRDLIEKKLVLECAANEHERWMA